LSFHAAPGRRFGDHPTFYADCAQHAGPRKAETITSKILLEMAREAPQKAHTNAAKPVNHDALRMAARGLLSIKIFKKNVQ